MWNVRGWSLTDKDNDNFRQTITILTNNDILALCETFLRKNDEISVDGYVFIGHNRNTIHPNARRGSGGVGVLIKRSFLEEFEYSLDKSVEDFLWVKFKHKLSDYKLNLCVCYLPPANSSRNVDCEEFFTELLKKVYEYQNDGELLICGDFNARCGDECDFIEGVDPIPPRNVLDEHCNAHGYQFIDFLVDCNLCMVNGRVGRDNFTCISPLGKSVVDYVLIPQENLNKCLDFEVLTMSELINAFNLHGLTKIPDHSLVQVVLEFQSVDVKDRDVHNVGTQRLPKFNFNDIPVSFLNDEESFDKLNQTILKIQNTISTYSNINSAYNDFTALLHSEMESKLKKHSFKQHFTSKKHKSRAKPYWSQELEEIWGIVCSAEKQWLSCKNNISKRNLRELYCSKRNNFNRLLRKAKRKFQQREQDRLHQEMFDRENPRDFWKDIGKLGLANERKQTIPMEILDENAGIKTETTEVLKKWKSDYDGLYNDVNSETFDQDHLEAVISSVENAENDIFPNLDCTSLNSPISRDEVKWSVYNAKLRKASGYDGIPADILRNEHCIDLLFTIIKCCFEIGEVPNQWLKGVINPIFKGDDARCPLNYRPITLLSIPCKIYASILNKRLVHWLDENEILSDGQNGFRKNRSCLDHIYTLNT
ncbi:MAG: endonuclease/exonuclease/phosphatase family protein, partial [Candidatus Thiodiazotropha sp.]